MTNAIEEIRRIKREGDIGLVKIASMLGMRGNPDKVEEIIYGNPSIDDQESTVMLRKLEENIQKEKEELKEEIEFRLQDLARKERRYEKLCDIDLDI